MNDQIQHSTAASASSGALLAGAALAGGLLLANGKKARAVSPALTFSDAIFGTGDVKVLNYALALEALETDLYAQGLQRLTTLGLSSSSASVQYLQDFGQIEKAHRDFFISALGSSAITAPGKPLAGATFDFNIETLDEEGVLRLVLDAEKTGVGAYIGAIPFFATTTYLSTAAAIQGTEARHTSVVTAIINKRFGKPPLPVAPLYNDHNGIDQPIAPDDVLAHVSPFIVLAT